MQHKQLEVQLCEAKLEQHKVMVAEEKHSSLEERQMLLEETLKQQTRCEQLTHQEADLRGQLSLYSEKFDEFQSTLTKSNEVFNTFKKEMDKVCCGFRTSCVVLGLVIDGYDAAMFDGCSLSLFLDGKNDRCAGEGDVDMEETLREIQ